MHVSSRSRGLSTEDRVCGERLRCRYVLWMTFVRLSAYSGVGGGQVVEKLYRSFMREGPRRGRGRSHNWGVGEDVFHCRVVKTSKGKLSMLALIHGERDGDDS